MYGSLQSKQVPFIDRQPSIINVGVSRAKQSFYVFGNQKFFEAQSNNNPKGATALLYTYLKKYS